MLTTDVCQCLRDGLARCNEKGETVGSDPLALAMQLDIVVEVPFTKASRYCQMVSIIATSEHVTNMLYNTLS